MKIPVNNPCCICGSTDSALLFEREYAQHRYPGLFAMRRCGGCGLLFNSPRLDGENLRELYQRNYYFFKRNDVREFGRIVDMYAHTIALVDGAVRRRSVLEIGSAKGYLLAVLKELGWETLGVEVSREAAAYARSRFGLQVFEGMLEDYLQSSARRTFPLVLAIDVIEHVPDPDRFVACAAEVVEPGGLFIIDTPNGAARDIDVQGPAWYGFNPFHIFLFSAGNLTRLLEQHGFVVDRAFSYRNSLSGDKNASQPRKRHMTQGWTGAVRRSLSLGQIGRRGHQRLQQIRSALGRSAALRNAVQRARHCPSYLESEDCHAELAAARKGVNLLVIARRAGASDDRPR